MSDEIRYLCTVDNDIWTASDHTDAALRMLLWMRGENGTNTLPIIEVQAISESSGMPVGVSHMIDTDLLRDEYRALCEEHKRNPV